MKTIYALMLALLLSAAAHAQQPVTFTKVPGGINTCTNRYYLSTADKSRGRLIWVDDFAKGAFMINGKTEKLKSLKFPDRLKYGFFNKNYTVSIRVTSQHNTTGHSYTGKGTLVIYHGRQVILSRSVVVAGGC